MSQAQRAAQEITEQVRVAEDQRYAAMVAADVAALGELLSDQAVYTHSYGGRDSKQELLDKLAGGDLVYHAIEHPVTEILVLGDAAVIIGEMHADVTSGGNSRRLDSATTTVWSSEDGRWRMAAFQSTRLPE